MRHPWTRLSAWIPWEERDILAGAELPGVYLLAHFAGTPRGQADPLAKAIIYIGETCDNSLKGRWYQFNRSAFHGKPGHSGGSTYREQHLRFRRQLHVAAIPIEGLGEAVQPYFIRHLERKLLWQYILKWGRPPACNRK